MASEEKKTKQVNGVKKVRYRGRAEVCVVSLFHGSGSTYLAKIIAVFLAKYRNEKTCLVETSGFTKEQELNSVDTFTYPCNLSSIYKKDYHFIVRDMGVCQALSFDELSEMERADIKCIVSWPDEHSLSTLASFIESAEYADSYIYFFNMVPKSKITEILDLMEDFDTVILPCTSLDRLDAVLVKRLFSIFGKG